MNILTSEVFHFPSIPLAVVISVPPMAKGAAKESTFFNAEDPDRLFASDMILASSASARETASW